MEIQYYKRNKSQCWCKPFHAQDEGKTSKRVKDLFKTNNVIKSIHTEPMKEGSKVRACEKKKQKPRNMSIINENAF